MARRVLECILAWFEEQEAEDTDAVLDLARQFAALRVTAVTNAGRRLSRRLPNLRIQYLEARVVRLTNARTWARLEGDGLRLDATLLAAQLRAVLLTYHPGASVTTPLAIPGALPNLGELRRPDVRAVDRALRVDLGVGDRARRRLLARLQ
jgi:hypothetical protein